MLELNISEIAGAHLRVLIRARIVKTLLPSLLLLFWAHLAAGAGVEADAPLLEGKHAASFSLHVQSTTVSQGHNALGSPYSGTNSLSASPEYRTSFTGTVFLGKALWKDAEVYCNPELAAGSGISGTHGVAGFPNGEIYRVDDPNPKPSLARLYFKQVFPLGSEREFLEDDLNQIAAYVPSSRLTLVLGRFSLNDFIDTNAYAHDPRTQFLNWSIWENGAWDYAADTRGYTQAIYLELNEPTWAARYALAMENAEANLMKFDTNVGRAHASNLELEKRYALDGRAGRVRLLAYLNSANMGNYRTTINTPSLGMDVMKSRSYSSKYGFGINWEQELVPHVGAFLRAGWDDGKEETWTFTEIDQTASVGASVNGAPWGRDGDTLGAAFAVNGISRDHQDYMRMGGMGFLLGDGALRYGTEKIVESYYLYKFFRQFGATADLQYVINPGFNMDRGPVMVMALRLHYEN
jgi:high affinity Mn2+ porin